MLARTIPELLVQLGFAYQLRWRESGRPYLPHSDAASCDVRSALGTTTRTPYRTGSLHSSNTSFELHDLRGGEKLLPGSYRPYGVIGDAQIELGRYDAAFASFERMISLRPSLASYARIAYARELSGDRIGAAAAMRLALLSAAGQPEPTAWAHVELAKLELAMGRNHVARRHVIAALASLPGYPSARVESLASRRRTATAPRSARPVARSMRYRPRRRLPYSETS
jgi:tetratricopeptide (TPR) repeat protein